MMYIVDDESLIQEHPEAIVCTLWQLCPVATLVTLSNAKYFRTILSVVSFTYLTYPNQTPVTLWLPDGNVQYLKGKYYPTLLGVFSHSAILAVASLLAKVQNSIYVAIGLEIQGSCLSMLSVHSWMPITLPIKLDIATGQDCYFSLVWCSTLFQLLTQVEIQQLTCLL